MYFVQDIETSYYPDDESVRHAVLDSYRPEFRYMTISSWNRERLRELGLDAELIPPGIDLDNFRPRPEVPRREDMVLALGRSNPLKNLPLTIDAWRALPEPRPELCLFGIEPELATEPGMRYVDVALATSRSTSCSTRPRCSSRPRRTRASACPPLESMATGGAVVCTDAHGNRDFCVDGENCLMPEPDRDGGRRAPWRGCSATPSCASGSGAPGIADGGRIRLGAADRRAGGVPGQKSRARATDRARRRGVVPEVHARTPGRLSSDRPSGDTSREG